MRGIKENKIMRFSYLIFLAAISVNCQKDKKSNLLNVHTFPKTLHEISGITMLSNNRLYAINDSGNENILFCLNAKGEVLQKIKIPETKNIDWEDLAYDKEDNIYIGDFGNNRNSRKDLCIYKISGILSNSISVSKIEFAYEDQKEFPPKKKKLNFDVEAFIYLENSLYLFTKNRIKKGKGITKLYKIPTTSGQHIAKLIGEYKICKNNSDCFITGAAINKKNDKIVLLTHDKVFLLRDFKGDNLWTGNIQKIKLHHNSQKEGICFKNDSTLFITDEKTGHKKASLYEYQLD